MADLFYIHEVKLKLAKSTDVLHAPGCLKFGEVYYLKHPVTHKISGPHVLDKYHNSKVLEKYFKQHCVYVPVIDFDFDIATNLKQEDLKIAMNYE